MDKQNPNAPSSREITDPDAFFSRRTLLQGGILAASTLATGLVYRSFNHRHLQGAITPLLSNNGAAGSGTPTTQSVRDAKLADGETLTPYDSITHYNNFYEFSTEKETVASECGSFRSKPWSLEVGGLCRKPTTFDMDDLRKLIPMEERIFRMRCVETWSMVVPWNGFALSRLLDRVEPLSNARYVAFQTLLDPTNFTNQRPGVLNWPYVEGLRMDEAMNPLATLVVGLYGRELPAQDGAPIRLAVPWKYGFKGAKSLVKIDLVSTQPPSTWNLQAPTEYGFYANVNPDVDHPRWSQAMETRIIGTRDFHRQPTLIFNGYAEQVAPLYSGMDLHHYF